MKPVPANHELLDAPTEVPSGSFPASACTLTQIPRIGSVVGDYELIDEIARGAMGVVFRARQKSLNRIVAIKMILDVDSADSDLLRRFANEAEAAAALDHPGIVPVYEIDNHQGFPYFSMACVEGSSLATILSKGPLQAERAATIACRVARAIAHAHAHQIIHRDLKPANILIDQQGEPRVTDFGVCKLLKSAADMTASGEMIGTPHYMPPEQAGSSKHSIGPASDVYSIGVVLYASLTGRPPFQAANPVDVLSQVLLQEPVPPRGLNASVPPDLEVITLRCLSKSPSDRYASADDLADDLQRFLDGEPIKARPPGVLRRCYFFLQRHVFLASVSGTAALFLIAFSLLALWALLHTRAQLADVQDALIQERNGAIRYVRSSDKDAKDTETTLAAYDARRLSEAAVRLLNDRPDDALQLAIHAVSLSRQHGVKLPKEAVQILQQRVEQTRPTGAQPLTTSELLARARQQIDEPFSEFERIVYGVVDPKTDDPKTDDLETDTPNTETTQ